MFCSASTDFTISVLKLGLLSKHFSFHVYLMSVDAVGLLEWSAVRSDGSNMHESLKYCNKESFIDPNRNVCMEYTR